MKRKLLIALCSVGMGMLAACSSEESQLVQKSSELLEDEFVSQVKFDDLLSPTTRSNPTIPPSTKTKGILRARIARKSRGCNHGFGLCDFKLFPKSSSVVALEQAVAPDEYLFEVVLDESSNTYEANLLLAKPLPVGTSVEMSSLKIDDDIYWVKDEVTMAEVNEVIVASPNSEALVTECQSELFAAEAYKIKAEAIEYNSTLGENGGYQVKLVDKIE